MEYLSAIVMNPVNKQFWLNDPAELFRNFTIIPTENMPYPERLNTLTRLLLLVVLGLYLAGQKHYWLVLVLGLLLIIIFKGTRQQERFGDCGVSRLNAAYELTTPLQFNRFDDEKRSYANAQYELTPLYVDDGVAQRWRAEPETCGTFTMIPNENPPVREPDCRGPPNYIVRSNIDHLPVSQTQTGLVQSRAIAEEAYKQSTLGFREGLIGEHVDRFRRERQHGCPDMKLNAFSAGSGN